jgi:DNA polymerase-2
LGDIGFIVDAFSRDARARGRPGDGSVEICLMGRLADGPTFAVVDDRERPGFYVAARDRERAVAAAGDARWADTASRTLGGEPCVRFTWPSMAERDRAAAALAGTGVGTYEADLKPHDAWRIDRGIHVAVRIEGPWRPGRRVARVYRNPQILPEETHAALDICSLDLETGIAAGEVRAAALAHRNAAGAIVSREVLFVGDPGLDPAIRSCSDEKALLAALRERLLALDPDVITGWNVVDFDMAVLARRFRSCGLSFDVGRSDDPVVVLQRTRAAEGRSLAGRALIRGRQVWDAARLVRA